MGGHPPKPPACGAFPLIRDRHNLFVSWRTTAGVIAAVAAMMVSPAARLRLLGRFSLPELAFRLKAAVVKIRQASPFDVGS